MSCDKKMNFEECELAVLRSAVDKIDKKSGRKKINDPDIKEIIRIVEDFLKLSKRVCYGGTAINNILPLQDQFYDKTTELPDYDFFSPEPLKDAKRLADIYYEKGFTEVEAKAGMHPGTFKVFVNFLPIADITYLVPELYKSISKKAIQVANIYYCPPNYLRMAMYLELSRPDGDVSRWEKVLKRLTLLNKHYPMKGKHCRIEDIQRLFQYGTKKTQMKGGNRKNNEYDYDDEEEYLENVEERIFFTVRDVLMGQGCVFFGAYANRMYLKTLKYLRKKNVPRVPDFDVLSDDPETAARILKERLDDLNLKKVTIKKKPGVGEIIADHYEVSVGPETVAFIYEPLECHSYNVVNIGPHKMRVATLDTMLSFYLAFIYVNRPYYDANRILCMSKFLFKVQQKNRLSQKGLLRRFSPDCYGVQSTKEKMREEKAEKYRELKNKRGSKEYDWYFLRYMPGELDKDYKPVKKKKKKKKKKRKTKKKSLLRRLGFGGKRKRRKTKRKRR